MEPIIEVVAQYLQTNPWATVATFLLVVMVIAGCISNMLSALVLVRHYHTDTNNHHHYNSN
jgi:hypothetical protein